jgi:NhaA family Na+:H+ antiporter
VSSARSETLGGVVMAVAAAAAMIWANSPWSAAYHAFVTLPAGFGSGSLEFHETLGGWVSEGLMAVFFLLIGLEIKREILAGELSSRDRVALPAAGALAGMIVPAVIFVALNRTNALALRGWAVPCATDIAFSLAVLRIVGNRVPQSLRVFLTAVAVLDDVGAILIIAIFYAETLSTAMLLAAVVPILALVVLNRARVASVVPYLLAGVVLWVCVLKSGIHATLAGVVTASAIPQHSRRGPVLGRLEHALKPWVVFAILPAFALLNAGVSLQGLGLHGVLEPVAIGAAAGLVLGKTIGVALGVVIAGTLRIAHKPPDASWTQVVGIAALCGIGFTMSLLLAALAYETQAPLLFQQAKLGVLLGSTIAAVGGTLALRAAPISRA